MSPAHAFYSAFKDLDDVGMNATYSYTVLFSDSAFGELDADRVRAMWSMLCGSQKSTDFRLNFEVLEESESKAIVHWEAFYTFSQTGRKVHNKIRAELSLEGGEIVEHSDSFNLYSWSKQALGFQGLLIGWSPFFKKKLQVHTNRMFDRWIAKQQAS